MVDYRPVSDDLRPQISEMLSYAFSPESGPSEPESDDEIPPQATVGENRGLFDGDDLVSVCRHHWFDTRVRGTEMEMAGLSGVATPPEFRRKGLVRTLLTEALKEYREREIPISALWPFKTPFYAQFGWGTAFRYVVQEGEPNAFRLDGADDTGRFYRAEEDDWAALDAVLTDHLYEYELAVDRTEEWWRKRAFYGWEDDPYIYVWEDDDPAGYVIYSFDDGDDGRVLRVWDMAYTTTTARRNLLRFVADHDSQVESAKVYGPEDSVLLDWVDDPAKIEVTVDAGAMVRIVDVQTALEAPTYPGDLDASITLSISDPIAEWNDVLVSLRFENGTATLLDVSGSTEPDVEIGIGPLSQLFVGYASIADLRERRDVSITDERAVTVLDTAFPESNVFLREGF